MLHALSFGLLTVDLSQISDLTEKEERNLVSDKLLLNNFCPFFTVVREFAVCVLRSCWMTGLAGKRVGIDYGSSLSTIHSYAPIYNCCPLRCFSSFR